MHILLIPRASDKERREGGHGIKFDIPFLWRDDLDNATPIAPTLNLGHVTLKVLEFVDGGLKYGDASGAVLIIIGVEIASRPRSRWLPVIAGGEEMGRLGRRGRRCVRRREACRDCWHRHGSAR